MRVRDLHHQELLELARGSRLDLDALPQGDPPGFPQSVPGGGAVQPLHEVERDQILAVRKLYGANGAAQAQD